MQTMTRKMIILCQDESDGVLHGQIRCLKEFGININSRYKKTLNNKVLKTWKKKKLYQ